MPSDKIKSLKKMAFFYGMGSVLNVNGTVDEIFASKIFKQSDAERIRNCWVAVGRDLITASKKILNSPRHPLHESSDQIFKSKNVHETTILNCNMISNISSESINNDIDLEKIKTAIERIPAIQSIPSESRDNAIRQIVTVFMSQKPMSPLPPPEDIGIYDQHIQGAGDRLMTMAELEQKTRMASENKEQEFFSRQGLFGQIYGFVFGILGMLLGTYLALHGQSAVGGIIAGGTVMALVTVSVVGRIH
jgi:uncharacterized membrane protein